MRWLAIFLALMLVVGCINSTPEETTTTTSLPMTKTSTGAKTVAGNQLNVSLIWPDDGYAAHSSVVNLSYFVSGGGTLQSCRLELKEINAARAIGFDTSVVSYLPIRIDNPWSFSNGTHVWIIVGISMDDSLKDQKTTEILLFNIATQEVMHFSNKPYYTDREACAKVNSTLIICSGGNNVKTFLNDIWWFNPAASITEVRAEKLPHALMNHQMASNGSIVWILGGVNSSGAYEKRILRYWLSNGSIQDTGNTIPGHGATRYTPSFEDGESYYWAGGLSGSSSDVNNIADEIYRFNKSSETVDIVAKIYEGRYGMIGFWTGKDWFFGAGKTLAGGYDHWATSMFKYTPATNTLINLTGAVNSMEGISYAATSAQAWNPHTQRGYIIGGSTYGYRVTKNITEYRPYHISYDTDESPTKGLKTFTKELANGTYYWSVTCKDNTQTTPTAERHFKIT